MHAIEPGELTLGSDNGSAFTARRFRAALAELGIRHRRGGYRDPESQAFIESWFGKLKQREVWLNEYETLDDARRGIGGYVDRYHHRPHSRLDYKTPYEVKQTWEDLQNINGQLELTSTHVNSRQLTVAAGTWPRHGAGLRDLAGRRSQRRAHEPNLPL